MANYSISNSTGITFGTSAQALTTTYKSIVTVANGTSNAASGFPGATAPSPYQVRRGKIYDILIGQPAAPADTYLQYDLFRLSAAGSSQNVFAGALTSASSLFATDPADGAANSFITANSSIETNVTVIADVWSVAINQRASYRWVAAPGSEFVYPATSSAGLALRALGAGSYTGQVSATVMFTEQ
jgi:hypothetical protein